jgi:glycine/D-amino acid oxidase-like deaminating enzyme
MQSSDPQVVIWGGGVGGLLLARELARAGIRCTVLDTEPFASYASTRNQSWLQSGPLFSVTDRAAALECIEGKRWFDRYAPDLIDKNVRCYYLFREEDQRDSLIEACSETSLGIRGGIPVRAVDIHNLTADEPILRDSGTWRYAARVDDCPMNTTAILERIARDGYERGVRYLSVRSLEAIDARWTGNRLRISLPNGDHLDCDALVLACGALIPKLLERFIHRQAPGFGLTKTPVLVVHAPISRSMLVTPLEDGYSPNFVPFSTPDGSGVTCCLARQNVPIDDCSDGNVTSDLLQVFANQIAKYFPEFERWIRQGHKCKAHLYACQKLNATDGQNNLMFSREHVWRSYAPDAGAPNMIFAYYPGKFTSAPVSAIHRAKEVVEFLGGARHTPLLPADTPIPTISKRQYFNTPDLVFDWDGKGLILEPLPDDFPDDDPSGGWVQALRKL